MRKLLKPIILSTVVVALTACGNLSQISKEGTTENPVFPDVKTSRFNYDKNKQGSWPNWDNVRQIEKGMTKEQVYTLIGRPHFAEGFYNVREWDYVFNYRENGEHKICQYKILFDKNMNVNQQWWLPNGCTEFANYRIKADVLFDFGKYTLSPKGQRLIKKLASDSKKLEVTAITLQGHTDRIGNDDYNIKLSENRAKTVKYALIKEGITAPISVIGYSKNKPVKTCDANKNSKQEKSCLQENRRVTITIEAKAERTEKEAGNNGPSVVKEYHIDTHKTSWK